MLCIQEAAQLVQPLRASMNRMFLWVSSALHAILKVPGLLGPFL